MPTEELGTLQKVDPSTLWNHEAHDFTPWLLENEEGLADALGIELELEEAEHRVGAFSLDIVGRDATNDTPHFFGIEIEAFRIGDSRPAPHFKLVAQPNEWQKVVRGAAQSQKASGRAALYAEFWDALLAGIGDEEPTWTRRRAGARRRSRPTGST